MNNMLYRALHGNILYRAKKAKKHARKLHELAIKTMPQGHEFIATTEKMLMLAEKAQKELIDGIRT